MPRHSSRSEFERWAKCRQAYFRDTSPTITDEGRSPTDEKGRRNCHLLALGCEEENLFPGIRGPCGAIDFFHERGIEWWKSAQSGDDIKGDGPTRNMASSQAGCLNFLLPLKNIRGALLYMLRALADFLLKRGIRRCKGAGCGDDTKRGGPTRNMASSQVACVNFLLPLKNIRGALLCMLRAVDDDVRDIVTISHDGNESPVEFEWIGLEHSLEGGKNRGANNTSIDAFLIAETKAGKRRAYLLEWKYGEQYLSTRPEYKGEGTAGDTRRRRYAERFRAPYSSFKPNGPDLDDFFYEPFYQLMRQRLLADLMVHQHVLGIDEAKVVVVVPECNWAYRTVSDGEATTSPPLAKRYPDLGTVEEIMRAVLTNPDEQFAMVAPVLLLKAVSRCLPKETEDWAGYWRERYGV